MSKRYRKVVVDKASDELWFVALTAVIFFSGIAGMFGFEDVPIMICYLVGGFGLLVSSIMYFKRRRVEYEEVTE